MGTSAMPASKVFTRSLPWGGQVAACQAQVSTRRPRMLVVDDENGPRQSLRMLFKDQYEVLLAGNVAEAVKMLDHEAVDIVITDIRMPNQTGMDLLREVRRHYPDIQVIILTGYGQLETAMEALEFGAAAYLEKPFDNDVMQEKVKACMERKRQEETRRAMEFLAMEANRFETLGHLVTGAMHDLATPLSVIGTHLDLILANPDRPGLPQRLETMRAQIQHCNDLVRTTMNFLRQSQEEHTPIDLNGVVELCLDVARPYLFGHQVVTRQDLARDIEICYGDMVMMRQAILNLIYNACQAMSAQREAREIHVETWKEPGYTCLAVEDTGPGITSEDQPKIFQTMFTTKGKLGTGLGLTVIKHVMESHKGEVELEQREGRGARFVLRFPVAQAS